MCWEGGWEDEDCVVPSNVFCIFVMLELEKKDWGGWTELDDVLEALEFISMFKIKRKSVLYVH